MEKTMRSLMRLDAQSRKSAEMKTARKRKARLKKQMTERLSPISLTLLG